MIRAAVIVAVLAGSAHAKGPVLAPHIAPIFQKGRTWTFDTAQTNWAADYDGKKTTTKRGKVTCQVASVSLTPKRALARITCDADLRKLQIAGYWIANAKGVSYIGFPDDPPPSEEDLLSLLAQPPLMGARPKPFEKATKVEGIDPANDIVIEGLRASSKAGGWCVYSDSSKLIDGGRVVQCFGPAAGFESGYNDVGGELDRFEYGVRTSSVRR